MRRLGFCALSAAVFASRVSAGDAAFAEQLPSASPTLLTIPIKVATRGATSSNDQIFANGFDNEYPFPVWSPAIAVVPPSTTGTTYYVDGANGNNSHDGKSLANAFKTIAKAASVVAAGDTALIRGGFYREGINVGLWSGTASGSVGKPITFGSYGDAEVIVDGSAPVSGWTRYSGNVWKAPISFVPIGIVVNDVPLKQVAQGQGGSTAPYEGLAGVTPGSGK